MAIRRSMRRFSERYRQQRELALVWAQCGTMVSAFGQKRTSVRHSSRMSALERSQQAEVRRNRDALH